LRGPQRRLFAMIITPLNRANLLRYLPKQGVVAEIGVDNGGYSRRIIEMNAPKKLHLVDPWGDASDEYVQTYKLRGKPMQERFEAVTEQFKDATAQGTVEIHRGYSYDIVPTFPEAYFDWVFV